MALQPGVFVSNVSTDYWVMDAFVATCHACEGVLGQVAAACRTDPLLLPGTDLKLTSPALVEALV